MDFSFTEDQLSIQAIARDFAQKRIAPVAAELDAKGEFPLDNIREMGQLGLMGIEVPHEYGGAGMDPIAYALAMMEIAEADCAHSTIMSVNNSLYCNGILKYGSEEQKQKYVRAIASGEAIGAYALTEPQSGSDASAMHTRATRNADGDWIINGKKSWITSGPVAKYIVLFAMTDADKGARGITAFMVDTARAGFGRGKTEVPEEGRAAPASPAARVADGRPGDRRGDRAVPGEVHVGARARAAGRARRPGAVHRVDRRPDRPARRRRAGVQPRVRGRLRAPSG